MSKADTLLKKSITFEKLALYSDCKSFLQAIAQDIQSFPPVSNKGINTDYMPGTAPPVNNLPQEQNNVSREQELQENMNQPGVKMPMDRVIGYPTIPQDAQAALFRINTIDGLGLPGKIDGKLGPETRRAINVFKKKFNVQQLSDAEVLQFAKMKAHYDPKYGT
jgi:hypothetical protein